MGAQAGDWPLDPYAVDGVELAARLNRVLPDGYPVQDSKTGAVQLPSGTTAQRPVSPAEGTMRYNTTLSRFEGFYAGQWAQVGGDSLPLFTVFWVPKRSAVPAGFVVADGQVLSRATYPDAWAGVNAGTVPIASEAAWSGSAVYRGCYTTGDGSSNFRVPDYNGVSSGSLGAMFLRGDGAKSAGTDGLIQASQNLEHLHNLSTDATAVAGSSQHTSAATGGTAGNSANRLQYLGNDSSGNYPLYASLSGQNVGGTEARPMSVTGCWAVKLFGAVINPGSMDAAQIASDLANLTAVVNQQCYKRSNILATVTQSSGVPTGGIIEQSSNANGRYVRLADGTQYCWNQVNLGSFTAATPIGNLYYVSLNGLPFAAVFSSSPVAHIDVVSSGGVTWVSQGSSFASPSATQNYVLMCPLNNTQTASALMYAVGRWFN